MCNPYKKQAGFEKRLKLATSLLKVLGIDSGARIFTRQFDNCFEMNDGDAIVWALMNQAKEDPILARGIERGGFKNWQAVADFKPAEQLAFNF